MHPALPVPGIFRGNVCRVLAGTANTLWIIFCFSRLHDRSDAGLQSHRKGRNRAGVSVCRRRCNTFCYHMLGKISPSIPTHPSTTPRVDQRYRNALLRVKFEYVAKTALHRSVRSVHTCTSETGRERMSRFGNARNDPRDDTVDPGTRRKVSHAIGA